MSFDDAVGCREVTGVYFFSEGDLHGEEKENKDESELR